MALVAVARFVREGHAVHRTRVVERAIALVRLGLCPTGPRRRASSAGVQTDEAQGNPAGQQSELDGARSGLGHNALQKADPDRKDLGAAAKHIAEKYPGLKSLMTRGKNLPSTIMNWRNELDKAKPDKFLGQFSEQMVDMEEFRCSSWYRAAQTYCAITPTTCSRVSDLTQLLSVLT